MAVLQSFPLIVYIINNINQIERNCSMNEVTIKMKRQSKIYKNTVYIRNFIVVDPINNSSHLSLKTSTLSDTDICFYVSSLQLPVYFECTYLLYDVVSYTLFLGCIHSLFFATCLHTCIYHKKKEQRTTSNRDKTTTTKHKTRTNVINYIRAARLSIMATLPKEEDVTKKIDDDANYYRRFVPRLPAAVLL